ncbi:MAG TPA: hypothetical protein VF867_20030 [Arthrobacter sp.]
MRKPPDWDLLLGADEQDLADHAWFPAGDTRTLENLPALEGLRFRNVYVTNRAIEQGSSGSFFHLYYNARITKGKVLHISDYRETE